MKKKFTIEDLKKIPLEDPRPIIKKKISEAERWKADLKKVPEIPLRNPAAENIGWTDRFIASRTYAGIRRGANIGIHLVGWTLVNSAALMAAGKDPKTALMAGAAAAGGESLLSLSAEKHVKEQRRSQGKTPLASIEWVLYLIKEIFNFWRSRKKKE